VVLSSLPAGVVFLQLVSLCTASAKAPKPTAPQPTVSIECDIVVLPRALARPFIPQLEDAATAPQAWERLQALIHSGEAALAAHLEAKGLAGKQLDSGATKGVRYPTEYVFAGPNPPHDFTKEYALEEMKAWFPAAVESVEFETRNVGPRLSAEFDLSSGASWGKLSAVVENVRFLRLSKFDLGVLASGEHVTMERPIFHSAKSSLYFPLRSGQRVLGAIETLPGDQGVEFVLLKATIEAAAKRP